MVSPFIWGFLLKYSRGRVDYSWRPNLERPFWETPILMLKTFKRYAAGVGRSTGIHRDWKGQLDQSPCPGLPCLFDPSGDLATQPLTTGISHTEPN